MPTAPKFADAPLSLSPLCELEVPPLDLIDMAARAGFASVGFRILPAAPGGIAYPLATSSEQAAVRAACKATGVALLYAELISIVADTRPADFLPLFEASAAIGIPRVLVAGDHPDIGLVTDHFAALCDLARPYDLALDFEFMPFRAIADLASAVTIVTDAKQSNGFVLVDALHFSRSNSSLDQLRALDRRLLGTFQICDAPKVPPPRDQYMAEARTRRLLPGVGGLDLGAIMDALPADVPIGVEIPIAAQYANLSPAERIALLATSTRTYLSQRVSS